VLADLSVVRLRKYGKSPDEPLFHGYRESSLKESGEGLLKGLANPRYFELQDQKERGFRYYDRLPPRAQIFVIAHACARQGMPELGDQLVTALAAHPKNDGWLRWNSFPGSLKEEIGRALRWRAGVAYLDPSKSWADIRHIFQLRASHCPKDPREENLMGRITVLIDTNRMRQPLPLDDPGELVWRLHEEQGERIPDDWPYPYPFEPRKSNGAMAALRKKGFEAVPALIEELRGPNRPSRSANRYSRHGGNVLTEDTHDLALAVLKDIAGFDFTHCVAGTSDKEWARMLGVIDDWWLAIQKKGEREWLVRTVSNGGSQADAVADCLRKRYPTHFFDAAIAAVRKFDESGDTTRRSKMIARLPTLTEHHIPGL
jgi:hypothetical protein